MQRPHLENTELMVVNIQVRMGNRIGEGGTEILYMIQNKESGKSAHYRSMPRKKTREERVVVKMPRVVFCSKRQQDHGIGGKYPLLYQNVTRHPCPIANRRFKMTKYRRKVIPNPTPRLPSPNDS